MKKEVGLFRPLRFDQLDLAASLLSNYELNDAFEIMNEKLSNELKGNVGRRKVINNITRVWSGGKKQPSNFQKNVLSRYCNANHDSKIAYQYLMTAIAFPFFRDTVNIVGKYLRITGKISNDFLLKEMEKIYGSAESVYKGTNAVVRGLIDWNLVDGMTEKGKLIEIDKLRISDEFLKRLIVKVLMEHYNTEYIQLDQLNEDAIFFPFNYHLSESYFDNLTNYEVIDDHSGKYVHMIGQR